WCCRSRSGSGSSPHRSRPGCSRRSRRGTSATATRPGRRACGTRRAISARSRRRPPTWASSRRNEPEPAPQLRPSDEAATPVRGSGRALDLEDAALRRQRVVQVGDQVFANGLALRVVPAVLELVRVVVDRVQLALVALVGDLAARPDAAAEQARLREELLE